MRLFSVSAVAVAVFVDAPCSFGFVAKFGSFRDPDVVFGFVGYVGEYPPDSLEEDEDDEEDDSSISEEEGDVEACGCLATNVVFDAVWPSLRGEVSIISCKVIRLPFVGVVGAVLVVSSLLSFCCTQSSQIRIFESVIYVKHFGW